MARPPLAEGILLPHLLDSRLSGYELHPFFRITGCSAFCPDLDPPPAPIICASVCRLLDMLLPFPISEIIFNFVQIEGSRSRKYGLETFAA